MKQNGAVPLIRANGFGRLPQMLEERAGERTLLKTLKSVGLPIAVRELGGMPIPAHALIGLFVRAGALTDDRLLGLHVGERMSYAGYGPWAVHAAVSTATLRDAILLLNRTSLAHQASKLSFSLEIEGENTVWKITRPPFFAENRHYSDHLILPMISYARLFLGSSWRPEWIEVDYAKDAGAAQLERALGAPVRFSRRAIGIAFRRGQLSQEKRAGIVVPDMAALPVRDIYDDVLLPGAPEPTRSFSAVVALRLIDGEHDIDGAARIAGIGLQGLQRQLRLSGYSYREVLEIARRKRAIHLLTKTEMPVADIAAALGYEDHPNFTRAFGRWMDCSPSAFRQMTRPERD